MLVLQICRPNLFRGTLPCSFQPLEVPAPAGRSWRTLPWFGVSVVAGRLVDIMKPIVIGKVRQLFGVVKRVKSVLPFINRSLNGPHCGYLPDSWVISDVFLCFFVHKEMLWVSQTRWYRLKYDPLSRLVHSKLRHEIVWGTCSRCLRNGWGYIVMHFSSNGHLYLQSLHTLNYW